MYALTEQIHSFLHCQPPVPDWYMCYNHEPTRGISQAVQWLGLYASNVGGMSSILVGELRSLMPLVVTKN